MNCLFGASCDGAEIGRVAHSPTHSSSGQVRDWCRALSVEHLRQDTKLDPDLLLLCPRVQKQGSQRGSRCFGRGLKGGGFLSLIQDSTASVCCLFPRGQPVEVSLLCQRRCHGPLLCPPPSEHIVLGLCMPLPFWNPAYLPARERLIPTSTAWSDGGCG